MILEIPEKVNYWSHVNHNPNNRHFLVVRGLPESIPEDKIL